MWYRYYIHSIGPRVDIKKERSALNDGGWQTSSSFASQRNPRVRCFALYVAFTWLVIDITSNCFFSFPLYEFLFVIYLFSRCSSRFVPIILLLSLFLFFFFKKLQLNYLFVDPYMKLYKCTVKRAIKYENR